MWVEVRHPEDRKSRRHRCTDHCLCSRSPHQIIDRCLKFRSWFSLQWCCYCSRSHRSSQSCPKPQIAPATSMYCLGKWAMIQRSKKCLVLLVRVFLSRSRNSALYYSQSITAIPLRSNRSLCCQWRDTGRTGCGLLHVAAIWLRVRSPPRLCPRRD